MRGLRCAGSDAPTRIGRYARRVPKTAIAPLAVIAAALLLAGCAATSAPDASDASATAGATGGATAGAGGGTAAPVTGLPECDTVEAAAAALLDGLAFSERLSAAALPTESYAQRLCVFSTADDSAQIGITLAAVPLLDSELETYGQSATAVHDDRLADHQVLQVYTLGDADDGHLDGSLSLFDAGVSVTIQGYAGGGSSLAALPQLTVAAATDAAFAVRAIVP